MTKRLPVVFAAILLLILGLQSVLVIPGYIRLSQVPKITTRLAGNLDPYMQATSGNATKQASFNPAFLQGNALLSGFISAIHIPTSSSSWMEKKIPDQVAINLTNSDQFNLADPIILSGFLRDVATGNGIANKTITFSTNGIRLGQTHSEDNGSFTIKISKDLPAGPYLVTASFKGAHLLTPASAATSFVVVPATVHIQTVPATAGITFDMDGRQFVSGEDGLASIAINRVGTYRLEVLLDKYNNPSERIEFGRWPDETFHTFRNVQVPAKNIIQVGLNIFHKVSFQFIDLDGYPVDTSRIASINIRSVQGDVFTLKPGDTPWLPSSRTARRQLGLEETDLLYSVNSVNIDGSNVVNSAQQRFFAQTDSSWTISLLLYSLQITARDGLFAAPVGKSVDIVYPNGEIKNYPLDPNGKLEIHALARGIYRASVIGIKGLGTSTPVALSRNQVVNLNIVTPLDLATFGSVSFFLAVGLIIFGRPWLLHFLLGRKRSPSKKVKQVPVNEN